MRGKKTKNGTSDIIASECVSALVKTLPNLKAVPSIEKNCEMKFLPHVYASTTEGQML